MAYKLGGYCWVDMSKSMQTSDLTPVTTAFHLFIRQGNIITWLYHSYLITVKD